MASSTTIPTTAPPLTTAAIRNELALQLAAGLMPIPDLLKHFELDQKQLAEISKDPQFRSMYMEAKAVWHSALNTKERTKIKAAMMVEDSLLTMFQMLHNPEIAPPSKIAVFDKLAEIAGAKPEKVVGGGATGDKFTININIPDREEEKIVLEVNNELENAHE